MAGKGGLAAKVRTGLAPELTVIQGKAMASTQSSASIVHPLDQVTFGKTARQHVKEFGALMGLICLLLAGLSIYKGRAINVVATWASVGVVIAALGYLAPGILRPVWAGWMKFAHVLGMVMTTVISAILWTLLLVPMAVMLRIIGKRVMDLRWGAKVDTYWETREEKYHDFKLLKNQF